MFFFEEYGAFKEESKVISHNLVNNHACSLPQNTSVVTYFYVASDKSEKSVLPTILLLL